MSDEQTHQVIFQPAGRQGRVAEGTTLLEAARQLGVDIDSICGGRQTCGKCKVIVEAGQFAKHNITSSPDHVTPMDEDEQTYFRRQGSGVRGQGSGDQSLSTLHPSPSTRLSCSACIAGDVLVTVPPESTVRKQVVRKGPTDRAIVIDPILRQVFVEVEANELGGRKGDWERLQDALQREWGFADLHIDLYGLRQLTPALKTGKNKITVVVWNEAEVIDVKAGFHDTLYGAAVDVGSTTIALHLCDLHTGAVLATESAMNPQVTFGEDLMSRVSYAMMHADGLQKMHGAVIQSLESACREGGEAGRHRTRRHHGSRAGRQHRDAPHPARHRPD